ncbi:MAG TPA: calcium-binding protein [Actinomycetota bacterium]|nr:calcium-binding protein [Actinomycetota bacterium]
MRRIWTAAVALAVAAPMTAATAAPAATCFGKRATIVGTSDDDTLRGTPGRDVIVAAGGRDLVHGRGGNDLICGGSGEDEGLYGDGGDDRIHAGHSERATPVFGGRGNDLLYDEPGGGDGQEMFGGPGNDVLKAGDSNGTYIDVLDGGPGDDVMEQGGAEGVFYGGAGDDVIYGGRGNGDRDMLLLALAPGPMEVDLAAGTMRGWGNDTVQEIEIVGGGSYDDTMIGDDDRNELIGAAGDDTLSGGEGKDCLLGASPTGYPHCPFTYELTPDSGDDVLSGDAGDDFLTGGDGNDAMSGGEGFDTTWYAASQSAVAVDLLVGSATGDGIDTLQEVEGVIGTRFADTLTGSEGADLLSAYGSNGDVLRGLGGDDELSVRSEADADGGAGSDTVSYTWLGYQEAQGLVIDLRSDSDSAGNTLAGIENVRGPELNAQTTVHGDDGPNVFFGSGGEDDMFGHGGDDVLEGWFGNDDLDGGDGTDTLDGGPGPHNGYDVCLNGETTLNCDWFSA